MFTGRGIIFSVVVFLAVFFSNLGYSDSLAHKTGQLEDGLVLFKGSLSELSKSLNTILEKLKEVPVETDEDDVIEGEFEKDLFKKLVGISDDDVARIKKMRQAILFDMAGDGKALVTTKNLEAFLATKGENEKEKKEDFGKKLLAVMEGRWLEIGKKNPIRTKLAKKWVRNAAVRVFHDPLRSFLELIVNACDTTLERISPGRGSVGKFGMGFFSILSFLWHKEEDWGKEYKRGAKITITTATRRRSGIPLYMYKMIFDRNDDNEISIVFKRIRVNKKNKEGEYATRDEYFNLLARISWLDPFYFFETFGEIKSFGDFEFFKLFVEKTVKGDRRGISLKIASDLYEEIFEDQFEDKYRSVPVVQFSKVIFEKKDEILRELKLAKDNFRKARQKKAEKKELKSFLKFVLKEQERKKIINKLLYELQASYYPTGTLITIEPKDENKEFSEKTLEKLSYYAHYLDRFPYVRMNLTTEPKFELIGSGDASAPEIEVVLDKKKLEVIDAGKGISPEIALRKLLVPSASTKSEKTLDDVREQARKKLKAGKARLPEFFDFKGKKDKDSHFVICVNGVVVIDKKLKKPLKDKDGNVKDFVIYMPQATQLTLARNELSISPDGKGFEEEYLKKTIERTIDSVLEGKREDHEALLAMYHGLKEWEFQSAAKHIQGKFSGHLKIYVNDKLVEQPKVTPVPGSFYRHMGELVKEPKITDRLHLDIFRGHPNHALINKVLRGRMDKKLIALDDELINYNFSRIENYLQQQAKGQQEAEEGLISGGWSSKRLYRSDTRKLGYQGKLISGLNVFFVPDKVLPEKKLSMFGLRRSLFAPQSILDEWKSPMEVANQLNRLFPTQELNVFEGEDKAGNVVSTNVTEEWFQRIIRYRDSQEPFPEDFPITFFKEEHANVLLDFLKKEKDQLFLPFWGWGRKISKYKEKYYEEEDYHGTAKTSSEHFFLTLDTFIEYVQNWIKHDGYPLLEQELHNTFKYFIGFVWDQKKDDFYVKREDVTNSDSALFNELKKRKGSYKGSEREAKEVLNLFFKKVSFVEIMNSFLSRLLRYYGFEKQEHIDEPTYVIRVKNTQIWPLKKITVDSLTRLFSNLLEQNKPGNSPIAFFKKEHEGILLDFLEQEKDTLFELFWGFGSRITKYKKTPDFGIQHDFETGEQSFFLFDEFIKCIMSWLKYGRDPDVDVANHVGNAFDMFDELTFIWNNKTKDFYLKKPEVGYDTEILKDGLKEFMARQAELDKQENPRKAQILAQALLERFKQRGQDQALLNRLRQRGKGFNDLKEDVEKILHFNDLEEEEKAKYLLKVLFNEQEKLETIGILFEVLGELQRVQELHQELKDAGLDISRSIKLEKDLPDELKKLETGRILFGELEKLGKNFKGSTENAEKLLNLFFNKVSIVEVMNLHLRNLLENYGFKKQKDIDNSHHVVEETKQPTNVIYVNKKQIWPIDLNEMSVKSLTELFSYLLFYEKSFSERAECDPETQKHRPKHDFDEGEYRRKVQEFTIRNRNHFVVDLFEEELNGNEPVFSGIKGVSEKELGHLVDALKDDIKWALNINFKLKNTISNISIPSYLKHFAPFMFMKRKKGRLSEQTKNKIGQMKESLMGLYNKYFSIDDDAFPRAYGGQRRDFDAKVQEKDVNKTESLSNLFFFLEQHKNKNLLDNLCNFQILDFTFKTDVEMQKLDLAGDRLYIPLALSNTPISLMAAMYEKIENKKLVETIISLILKRVRSAEELSFIVYIVLHDKIQALLRNSKKLSDVKNNLKHIIQFYVQGKIDKDRLLEIYKKNRVTDKLTDRIKNVADETVGQSIIEFLEQKHTFSETTSFFNDDLADEEPLLGEQKYSLKKLLVAHVQDEGLASLLEANNLKGVKKELEKELPSFDLGKITQSIEAGSEKKPLHGSIVECLQNSIDAARDCANEETINYRMSQKGASKDEIMKELAQMTFMLETMPAEKAGETTKKNDKKRHLVLTIRDNAGFPNLKILLTNFILPDYSGKSPKAGNIGDMGNGSFKIYQHAEKASILTRMVDKKDRDEFYLLLIEPEREEGMVKDLKLSFEKVSDQMKKYNPNFFGTSIKITFRAKENKEIQMDLIAAKDFLQNCVGTTQAKIKDVRFTCYLKTGAKEEVLNSDLSKNIVFEYPVSLLPSKSKELLQEEFAGRFIEPKLKKELEEEFEERFKTESKEKLKKEFERRLKSEVKEKLKEEFYDKRVLFRISRRKEALRQSYVTTSGLPFRDFSGFVKDMNLLPSNFISMLSNGYVIDFDLSTYQPVQSRTHLTMNDYLIPEVRKALFEGVYFDGLRKAKEEIKVGDELKQRFLKEYFFEFNSRSKYGQLRLHPPDDERFQNNFKEHVQGKSKEKTLKAKSFFDFYRPLSIRDPLCSFYDHIRSGLESFVDKKLEPYIDEKNEETKRIRNEWVEKKKNDLIAFQNLAGNERNEKMNELIENYKAYMREKKKDKDTLEEEWRNECNRLFEEWTQEEYPDEKYPIKDVIVKWFGNKRHSMKLKIYEMPPIPPAIIRDREDFEWRTADEVKNQNQAQEKWRNVCQPWELRDVRDVWGDGDKAGKLFGQIITNFYKEFCMIYRDLLVKERKMKPGTLKDVKLYYKKVDSAAAYYNPNDQSINVNINDINIKVRDEKIKIYIVDLLNFIVALYRFDNKQAINKIKRDKVYRLFDPTGYTPTIIHELEHARRASDHKKEGSHTRGEDAKGNQDATFDSCANSYARLAMDKELLGLWEKRIKERIDRGGYIFNVGELSELKPFFEKWKHISAELGKIEADHSKFFYKKLGFEVRLD